MNTITNVKISKGDSLSKIAKNHFTTVDKILDLNPQIKDKNLIIIGDTLQVPTTIFEKEPKKFQHENVNIEKEINTLFEKDTKLTQNNNKIPSQTNISKNKDNKNNLGINLLKYTSIAIGTLITGLVLVKKGNLKNSTALAEKASNTLLYPTPKANETTKTIKNMLTKKNINYKQLINESIPHKPTKRQHKSTLKRLNKAFGIMQPTPKAQKSIAEIEEVFKRPTNYQKVCESYIPLMPQNHKITQQELKKVFKNM